MLRDDLEAAAARFEVGGTAAAVSSSDAEGLVTVTLSPIGAIQAVQVAAGWGGSSTSLSRAVRQAAENATALRTEQWATAAAEPDPGTAFVGPVPTGDGVWSRLSEIADAGEGAANTDVQEALLEMSTTISDGMDELSEELAAHQTDTFTGSSPSGAAVANLSANGELLGVDVEDEWVRAASHTNIGREATEAIAAAQQQAPASSSASIVARSPLGDIQALSNDQYKQMLPMQKAAPQAVMSTFTDGISTALGQVRTALYVFYAALAVTLAALVAGIIRALASSATVVGLPAAPFIAGAAAVAAAAACWGGSENLLSAATSANTLLRQKLNDNTGYRDGHWPSAASM